MKKLIKYLEQVQEELERVIAHREEYHSNRSDAWMDSKKGLSYEEKTESLSNKLDTITDMIEEIKEMLS